MYKDDLVYEFNDDMWYLYHQGTIDNSDDFEREMHQWLENKVIYRDDCKKYINELNVYNPFEDHDIFGRANNWYEAGYNALWDLLHEHDEALKFNEMKLQNENA
tara:strand:+ start:332 stop:643 length:312 start_codon:yes stop_codon:yes gene_type:complete